MLKEVSRHAPGGWTATSGGYDDTVALSKPDVDPWDATRRNSPPRPERLRADKAFVRAVRSWLDEQNRFNYSFGL